MPHCPECKSEVSSPRIKEIQVMGLKVPTIMAYCPKCGCILGIASQEKCKAK